MKPAQHRLIQFMEARRGKMFAAANADNPCLLALTPEEREEHRTLAEAAQAEQDDSLSPTMGGRCGH